MEINEDFLYFLWEEIVPNLRILTTTNGKKLRVINPGLRNKGTGPDYFNALIKLDDLSWAGNVEIHVRSSDWILHHHQYDRSYQNIILHVVWKSDHSAIDALFDTLEISNYIPQDVIQSREKFLFAYGPELPCAPYQPQTDSLTACHLLENMSAERLRERTKILEKKFIYFEYNWQQLFYSVILESFGFHVNALPMFQLSERVNFNMLIKEKDSFFRLYSLLAGTSSLLYEMEPSDERNNLIQEFEYLKNKYRMEPLPEGSFKLHGIRPANHPLIRLAQFSCLFFRNHDYFQLLNFPLDKKDFISMIENAFKDCNSHLPTWKYFKAPGKNSIRLILINAWCIFLFYRGMKTEREELKKLALDILESLPPENNHKTRLFKKFPIRKNNALLTQGMIHLYNEYCRKKKCYSCEFGRKIMKKDFF